MVELIVTIGVPATGKSTWAEKISEREGYEWVSSDNIRKENNYNISNADVFDIMFDRTVDALDEGRSVIYDATNLSSKRRHALIENVKSSSICDIVLFRCEVFVAPIDTIKKRNAKREGKDCVPEDVIDRMITQFQFPQYFEGWDYININDNSVGKPVRLDIMKGFDQKSKYHSLDLYEHSRTVVEKAHKLSLPLVVSDAAWYHDIGKVYCQTIGKDGWAHYYGHENVSAYLFVLEYLNSRYYNFNDFLTMEFVLNYHMRPYNWTQKSYDKDKELFGEDYIHILKLFHECDISGH